MSNVTGMEQAYLHLEEVAARLRRSSFTVRRWVREGRLPHLRIGVEPLFDWAEVQAAVRAGALESNRRWRSRNLRHNSPQRNKHRGGVQHCRSIDKA